MEWCDQEGLDGSDRADLLYLIRAMDRAFLKHAEEKSAKTSSTPKSAEKGRIGGN